MESVRSRTVERYETAATWHHQALITDVVGTMRQSLSDPMPLADMADLAYLSPYHFARVFRRVTGIPPGEFLTALRLERAKHLLLTTDLGVADICFEVGYTSLGTFTTRFTEQVGVTPSRLRHLPEPTAALFENLGKLEPAPVRPAPASVTGSVTVPDNTGSVIFIGLFPTEMARRRPVAGTVLTTPGDYQIHNVPDGRYRLLTAELPLQRDPLEQLLPSSQIRVGGGQGHVTIQRGHVSGATDLWLRPMTPIDPPILTALPALLMS